MVSRKEKKSFLRDGKIFVKQEDFVSAGEMFILAGKLKKAQNLFLKGKAPEKAAEIALKREKPDEAIEILKQAALFKQAAEICELVDNKNLADELYLEQAKIYFKESKTYLAAEMCEKGHDWSNAAKYYIQTGFFHKAVALYLKGEVTYEICSMIEKHLYKEMIELNKDDLESLIDKCCQLLKKKNESSRVVSLYKRFGFKIKAAQFLEKEGKWNEAVELYKDADALKEAMALLRKYNQNDMADLIQADYFAAKGNVLQAAELYAKQNKFHEAAQYYLDTGSWEKAAIYFEKAEAFTYAAENFERAGKFEQAIKNYGKTGDINKAAQLSEKIGNFEAAAELQQKQSNFFASGQNFLKAGFEKEAISSFQKVEPTHPKYFQVQIKVIDHFIKQGLDEIAEKKLKDMTKEASINKQTVALFYRLAKLLKRTGKAKEAKQIFENVISYDINYGNALQDLKEINEL